MSYFFGIPRAIETGGVVMNVRLGDYVATHANDHQQKVQFRQQIGMLSSSLEHAIPEQMFVTPENPGEAVSAVKALSKASQQGQRIYHITPENMATTLPNIHHNELTMDEIRAALAVGKEVTTHTDAISVPGWSGAGYIIMDPETGIGAYKIGGGMNGSALALSGALILSMGILSLIFIGVGGPLAVAFAAMVVIMGAALITAGLALIAGNYTACSGALSVATDALGALVLMLAGVTAFAAITIAGVVQNFISAEISGNICNPNRYTE